MTSQTKHPSYHQSDRDINMLESTDASTTNLIAISRSDKVEVWHDTDLLEGLHRLMSGTILTKTDTEIDQGIQG